MALIYCDCGVMLLLAGNFRYHIDDKQACSHCYIKWLCDDHVKVMSVAKKRIRELEEDCNKCADMVDVRDRRTAEIEVIGQMEDYLNDTRLDLTVPGMQKAAEEIRRTTARFSKLLKTCTSGVCDTCEGHDSEEPMPVYATGIVETANFKPEEPKKPPTTTTQLVDLLESQAVQDAMIAGAIVPQSMLKEPAIIIGGDFGTDSRSAREERAREALRKWHPCTDCHHVPLPTTEAEHCNFCMAENGGTELDSAPEHKPGAVIYCQGEEDGDLPWE